MDKEQPAEREKIKAGIPQKEYDNIHKWVLRYFGLATRCESEDCTSEKPKRFEWALRKECSYARNISNYIQLCPSCHRKYDLTEAERANKSAKKIGQLNNGAKLSEISVLEIYRLLKNSIPSLDIAKRFKVHPTTISDIKRGKRWPHLHSKYIQNEK